MQTLSYDDYDKLLRTFATYGTPAYIPSPEQIDLMTQDPDKYLRFALYLSEFGPSPSDDTEKYERQLLTQFLYGHISLVD